MPSPGSSVFRCFQGTLFDRVQRPTGARFDHVTGDHAFRHVRHYFRVKWQPEDLADALDTVIGDQLDRVILAQGPGSMDRGALALGRGSGDTCAS